VGLDDEVLEASRHVDREAVLLQVDVQARRVGLEADRQEVRTDRP